MAIDQLFIFLGENSDENIVRWSQMLSNVSDVKNDFSGGHSHRRNSINYDQVTHDSFVKKTLLSSLASELENQSLRFNKRYWNEKAKCLEHGRILYTIIWYELFE